MKHIRTCGAVAAAMLSGAAFAATHFVDIAWSPDGRFGHKAQIAAGKFVEVCGKLAVGKGVHFLAHRIQSRRPNANVNWWPLIGRAAAALRQPRADFIAPAGQAIRSLERPHRNGTVGRISAD